MLQGETHLWGANIPFGTVLRERGEFLHLGEKPICRGTRCPPFDKLNQGQQKKILCKEITGGNTPMTNKF